MFELRAWIQFTYCRSLYQDNVSKRKAVIRESVSLYPSKISKRLAYFIFKPDHRISGLPHWKNTAGQIKSRLSLLKSSKTFWETLSLLFIMFVQDCVSCAIKHLSGYSNKIWNSWMCIAAVCWHNFCTILTTLEILQMNYDYKWNSYCCSSMGYWSQASFN